MPARHCAPPPDLATAFREFIAAGAGSLPAIWGELTWVVPFDLVDAVLEETLTVQRRLRDLPARAGVHSLLAVDLFPEVGYPLLWQTLTAELVGLDEAQTAARAAT
ncbi:transposase domain-containing protein [Streptomyces sp. NPDC002004]